MSDQPGNRIPSTPKDKPWEDNDVPQQPIKYGDTKSGGQGGDPTSGEIGKPQPGDTFSGKR